MKKQEQNLPLVTIFGRTNVGKSTLFNCLTEKKHALTSKQACTTRDSNKKTLEWQGRKMELIDTGGIMDEDTEEMLGSKFKKGKVTTIEKAVQKQALEFLKQSDLILFVTDGRSGLLPQDEALASFLKKKYPQKTLLVVNKIDHAKYRSETADFYQLNIGDPHSISAMTGSGTGDLLDEVVKNLPSRPEKKEPQPPEDRKEIKACIIGKPNVGKSSLLNSLTEEERVIISDLPHTTREPQDMEVTYQDTAITLVDTAGISKKGNKSKGLEKFGISKSLRALKRSDIAILVLDIHEGITHQDAKLVEEIFERNKSLIIVANKWDKVEEKNTKEYTEYIRHKFPYAVWAPIHFISARTGSKVKKIWDTLMEVHEQRQTELSQSQLDNLLSHIVKIHPPAKAKGVKPPYIYKINQTKTAPPRFTVKIGSKDTLHFSYVRFIKNKLRERFGFLGTPINIDVLPAQNSKENKS
ncbi:MAG TPA: ribosome biogenesis GTPase Der [Patescibacteria group bacterium]|nr:ribosome biogenesis GTPase Der [Patescibacteria group bacterium]